MQRRFQHECTGNALQQWAGSVSSRLSQALACLQGVTKYACSEEVPEPVDLQGEWLHSQVGVSRGMLFLLHAHMPSMMLLAATVSICFLFALELMRVPVSVSCAPSFPHTLQAQYCMISNAPHCS